MEALARSVDDAIARANREAADAWLDAFFADYFARRPIDATFCGVHDHDHRLPHHSAAGCDAAVAGIEALLAGQWQLDIAGLDWQRRADLRLEAGQLQIERWEMESRHFQRGNPAVATGDGVFAIISLFQRDSEPFQERVEAAIARMEALPAFLVDARRQVSDAPVAWTERAVAEADAAIRYFGNGLRRLAAERAIDDAHFLAAAEQARIAFAAHRAWLDGELRHQPRETVACGDDALSRYLRLGHALPPEQDAAWVERVGQEALLAAGDRLDQLAAAIAPGREWRDLLPEIAADHPAPDGYYRAFATCWEAARATAVAADLVTWPEFPIEYVPIPASDWDAAPGLYYPHYRCPPPFGRRETQRYLVTPIDGDLAPEERTRLLRAANHAAIKLNHVVHHSGLGHRVQNWYAFQAASRVGQMAGVDGASRIALPARGR